jgi:hypothetical protein
MGQTDRALDTLEEAAAKWPEDADLRLRLSRAALDARKYDRVTAIVDAALTAAAVVDPELAMTGMQAIFERAQGPEPLPADAVSRMKRFRDAYVAAGGSRQSLVNEWVAAVEKKGPDSE